MFNSGNSLYYIDPVTSYLTSVSSGFIAESAPGSGQSTLEFASLANVQLYGSVPCTCSVSDTTDPEGLSIPNSLNCLCGTQNLWFINPINGQSYLAIGSTRPPFATSPAIYPVVAYVE